MPQLYQAIRETVKSKGQLIPYGDDLKKYLKANKDYYVSLYQYTEEQKKQFEERGTVSGITSVTSNRLYFDLDKEGDLDQAKTDAVNLAKRLIDTYNIPEEAIQAFWSGKKGYALEVQLKNRITPEQMRHIIHLFAKDFTTLDTVVVDPNRIIRIPNTIHQSSNLYKIPLELWELEELSVDQIQDMAKTPREMSKVSQPVDLPASLLTQPKAAEPKLVLATDTDLSTIDFSKKMKGFTNCKWALCDGYEVRPHDRHHKLTAIVATAKSLNALEGQAYYMAKHAMKRGVERYGGEECSKEDLNQIVRSIYSPTWQGGTYSCKDGKSPWLTSICSTLGVHKCQALNVDVVSTSEVFGLFNDYAVNFDQNIIKTGIEPLDARTKFMVGTSNGILAPPGVGKTTLSLALLNYNSSVGNHSVFFSYDMFHSLVYLRLIQKHFGYNQDKIFDIFRHDKRKAEEIKARLEEEYKNVHFCFKSGQTADEIYETILDTEQKIGNKIRLGMVDYNELVISNVSDPTQSSAQTAQRLRQIANDTSTCMITLLQPSKIYSNPADEITTYQGAKGSGAIAQSMSLIISLSRPGFSPRTPENDKYLTVNALKNRMGSLFTVDLGWDGASGSIRELTSEEEFDLKALREKKKLEAEKQSDGWN